MAGRKALRTSISAQACQSALLLAPGRRRVPSLNQRRASSVKPVSAASTPSAWYRCGLPRSPAARTPCTPARLVRH